MSSFQLSIVIPSRTGLAMPLLRRLLREQLPRQTFQGFEVHVVVGDDRQGRAINEGVRRARGDRIATMDDDIELGSDTVLESLMDVLDAEPNVGIVGAACPVPEDASAFQRAALRQIPRWHFPVVREVTDSDMVQHGCLAMPRGLFREIGGEDEDLPRGLDPIIRTRVRERGLRVVVAPNCWFYHRPPSDAASLLRMYFRNGRGSSIATRHFPDRVFELGTGDEGDDFPSRRPFPFRVARRIGRMGLSLVRGEWVGVSADVAYALGFSVEYLLGREPPRSGPRHVVLEESLSDRIHIWRSLPGPTGRGDDRQPLGRPSGAEMRGPVGSRRGE